MFKRVLFRSERHFPLNHQQLFFIDAAAVEAFTNLLAGNHSVTPDNKRTNELAWQASRPPDMASTT
jgi:hypothetical protein